MGLLVYAAQVLATVAVLIFGYYYWVFQYWKKRNVPYIEPKFPYGNLVSPAHRKVFLGQEIADLYNIAKSKGWKYCGIYSTTRPILLSVDLDFTKIIMNRDFHHFNDRGMFYNERDEPIGAHLFALGGTKWKNLRAKLSPTFTSGKMRGMFSTLVASGATMEKFLQKECNTNNAVEIKQVLVKYTTDIIGSCAFGVECNSFEDPDSDFIKYGRRIFERNSLQNIKFLLALSFPELARFLRMRLLPKDLSDFFFDMVRGTINYRKKNNVVRPDFLQLLMEILQEDEQSESKGDGKSLTIAEAVAQCFVFFIAGFETSSTTMTFALYELTKHPEIQEKAREEIYRVLKKHHNKITYDAVKEMIYLEQIINETLRMFPALPLVTRKCSEDWKDPDSGLVIEKGTRIFIPILGFHYDSDNFENPEKFDPDRFTQENKEKFHPYAHIPFGEGPRLCIGMRFGMMQTKVGLISILKDYKVTLNSKTKEPLEFDTNITIPTTKGGIWLNLEKIENS